MMKIISKYKDYYDYMVHKYGIDPKVTIDRTEGFVITPSGTDKEGVFSPVHIAICGEIHSGLIDHEGTIHWGKSAEQFGELRSSAWFKDGKEFLYFEAGYRRKDYIDLEVVKTKINDKEKCPVVWLSGYSMQNRTNWPKLSELNIPGYIEAEDMFNRIYSWVSAHNEPDTTDTRDDTTKLLNAGFDKKKSFRHRK